MSTKEKRKLKDLNLLDKFLFDEAMEDEENMKTLLDIILGQDTHLKQPPQTEKECRSSLGLPFLCFADPLERPIYFPCLVLSI